MYSKRAQKADIYQYPGRNGVLIELHVLRKGK